MMLDRNLVKTFISIVVVVSAGLSVESVLAQSSLQDYVDCTGKRAESALCKERQTAFDTLAQIETLRNKLVDIADPPWEASVLDDVERAYTTGKQLFDDQYYGKAYSNFEPALQTLKDLESKFEIALSDLQTRADAQLANDDFDSAIESFYRLRAWSPNSTIAVDGLSRAEIGKANQSIVNKAVQLFDSGSVSKAEELLETTSPGWHSSSLNGIRSAIAKHRSAERFKSAMARGFDHFDAGNWALAEHAFTAALKENPTSTLARESLTEAQEHNRTASLAELRKQAEMMRDQENWRMLKTLLDQIIQIDPNDERAAISLVQTTRILDIESRLDAVLVDPDQPATKSHRTLVTKLLAEGADLDLGSRVLEKKARLERRYTEKTTPVRVVLYSDQKTQVIIRPGQSIGTFDRRTLNVLPGKYVIFGRRSGYREKMIDLNIAPGDGNVELQIVCDERF